MEIDTQRLERLLEQFRVGEVGLKEVISQLKAMPYQDLDFAKVDHHRELRRGFPEVILGQGKTPEQISAISEAILENSDRLLVTRVDQGVFEEVKKKVPDASYSPRAKAIVVNRRREVAMITGIVVVSGGTSDLPVAEEAALTAELMGCQVKHIIDVGVSGLHRLLSHLPSLQHARVIVAVAGMEGALPSVVAGLVAAPVIAVPTSIGYGASFEGIAPLLTMLNSCAPGVSVVNIDNGFGAGYLAALINMASVQGTAEK
ncbi:MAG: nickel pincer cofactor biosynthesis protein LarB [Chloroflexi bacterium]|nr:nickel pincer cofactor biosynthesis protein LarB [Chloroflexota bacterium]